MPKIGKSKSIKSYTIEYENYKDNVERYYFFIIEFLKDNIGYDNVQKLQDIYQASESSTFWNLLEQRKAVQQDRVSQYMGVIGGMVKSLIQQLHELRIMEEKYNYYKASKSKDPKISKPADIALKSLWIDLVEGGAQSPKSVFGMAAQVGFVTLPDLFFSATPKDEKDIEKSVESFEVNPQVKNILKHKLFQFIQWKGGTEDEITSRWVFMIKHLKQHVDTMNLYVSWIAPYLRNVKKLQQGETATTTDLLKSSEGAIVDLEILATKKFHNRRLGDRGYTYKAYFPTIQVKIHWRATPKLEFQAEGYRHQGALHIGRAVIEFYAYSLSDEDIKEYQKKQIEDNFELLSSVNATVDALKDEVKKWLKKADEIEKAEEAEKQVEEAKKSEKSEKREKKPLRENALIKPLFGIGSEVSSMFAPLIPKKRDSQSEKQIEIAKSAEEKTAGGQSKVEVKILYEVFKKAHGMIQW